VRELQNVIQRAVILSEDTLAVDEAWLQPRARPVAATRTLGRLRTDEEARLIETAPAEAHGRVAGPDGAAARLGVPRSTLESKIRSLHIDKRRF
jgi:formate hydrogenlyase transcriptional activator